MQVIELETSSQLYRLVLPFLLALGFHTLFVGAFLYFESQPNEQKKKSVSVSIVKKKIEYISRPEKSLVRPVPKKIKKKIAKKPPMPVKKKVAKLKIQEPEKSIRKEPPKVTIAKKKIPPIPEVKKKELPKSKEIREISKTKSSPLAPPSQKKIKKPDQPLNTAPPLFGISLSSTITKTNGVSLPGEKSGTHFNRPGRDAPRESGKFGDETTYQPFTPDQVDEMPVLLKEVRPKFPDEAKKSGWEGAVLLELSIDEEGQVTDVQILKGRYNVLNEAAKKAAFQFLFSPAKIKNKSIPVRIDYAVTFLLQN